MMLNVSNKVAHIKESDLFLLSIYKNYFKRSNNRDYSIRANQSLNYKLFNA